MWIRSAFIAPITSRDVASTERIGLRVFGSERSATTSLPPDAPVSPANVAYSCGPAAARSALHARITAMNSASFQKLRRWEFPLTHAPLQLFLAAQKKPNGRQETE